MSRALAVVEGVSVRTLGVVWHAGNRYPLYCARHPAKALPDLPCVLISAGVHGDEPAGVYAALDFLRMLAAEGAAEFNICVIPCVNPSGFETASLESLAGVNLNRQFGCASTETEVSAIESWLAREDPRFRVTFDLHEVSPDYSGEGFTRSDNPRGCYLYETVGNVSWRIGRALIDSLPKGTEVCRWPKIYRDDNRDGVVSYPEAGHNLVYRKKTTLDAYLNGRHTLHSFTTETPTGWPLEKRIGIQVAWIRRSLSLIQKQMRLPSGDPRAR